MARLSLRMEGLRNNRRHPWIRNSNRLKIRFAGDWYNRRSSALIWNKYESLRGYSGLSWFMKRFLK